MPARQADRRGARARQGRGIRGSDGPVKLVLPPPHLPPYKVDTPRPSPRTNRTRRVPQVLNWCTMPIVGIISRQRHGSACTPARIARTAVLRCACFFARPAPRRGHPRRGVERDALTGPRGDARVLTFEPFILRDAFCSPSGALRCVCARGSHAPRRCAVTDFVFPETWDKLAAASANN